VDKILLKLGLGSQRGDEVTSWFHYETGLFFSQSGIKSVKMFVLQTIAIRFSFY
jgi:hypothetical protein